MNERLGSSSVVQPHKGRETEAATPYSPNSKPLSLNDTRRAPTTALSKQGRGGGYQLVRNPKALTLKSVSEAVDGLGVARCFFDSTVCDGRRSCRLAVTWHPMREALMTFLETETIHSVAERSRGRVDRFELSELEG